MLTDKTLLVTGGTGSFGEAVVRRALAEGAAEVRIFSRDEKKQDDLRHALPDTRLRFVIGDVRDYDALAQAMVETDLVFHAAALKQVPSCEFHPFEAVRTNILGTENVLNAAIAARASHVTVLSTESVRDIMKRVMSGSVSVRGLPCLICLMNSGITEPRDAMTLP